MHAGTRQDLRGPLRNGQNLVRGGQGGEDRLRVDEVLDVDAVLLLDDRQLGLEQVELPRELDHALLEDHVVQAPLLPRPLGRLVVPPAPVPVALVLAVVRDELALLALVEHLAALDLGGGQLLDRCVREPGRRAVRRCGRACWGYLSPAAGTVRLFTFIVHL